MNLFNSFPEPWAKLAAVVLTCGVGAVGYLLMEPAFGLGMMAGAVVCMAAYWGSSVDEAALGRQMFRRGKTRAGQESEVSKTD